MTTSRRKPQTVLAIAVLIAATWPACRPALADRIVAWGMNTDGQCNVPEGRDFVAISARWKHNLALRVDGSIAAWGQNNQGQSNAPAGNDFVAVAAGQVHSLALKADGSLVAWGYGADGQCNVPSGHDFVAIAAGDNHNLALRADGAVVGWGKNDYGQAGTPVGTFIAIAAGSSFSLGLRSDGYLVVWGQVCDSMGFNDTCRRTPPVDVELTAISAGGFTSSSGYALALKTDGSIAAWGDDRYGQCDVPTGSQFTAISAGSFHGLALRADGSLAAWGRNDSHQCDVPAGKDFVAVSAGSGHSVALKGEAKLGHPTAEAGDDLVARANEEVTLDGSKSTDEDGYITLYTWKRLPDDVIIYSGPEPTCTTRALGRAEEIFELTVTDNDLLTASDTVTIVNRLLKDIQDQNPGMP
jgi:alpha-tubulin suppressor-like RCC1 family protein